jgi:hypothetical protein
MSTGVRSARADLTHGTVLCILALARWTCIAAEAWSRDSDLGERAVLSGEEVGSGRQNVGVGGWRWR